MDVAFFIIDVFLLESIILNISLFIQMYGNADGEITHPDGDASQEGQQLELEAEKNPRIRKYSRLDTGALKIHGLSIQGSGHLKNDIPCQDYHSVEPVGKDFTAAVVSDGAGSKKNSDKGSLLVCNLVIKYLKEAVTTLKWSSDNLPGSKEWDSVVRRIIELVQIELALYAKEEGCSFDSLGATMMILLYSPEKSYFAHVGDGRAGVLTSDGWNAVLTPHKGAEANQTVFMTNKVLDPDLAISGVAVPETVVIDKPISGFVLMSDGMENGLWIKSKREDLPNGDFKYKQMNMPFAPALNDVTKKLENSKEKPCDTFFDILDHYNKPLAAELDDKTLCLAYTAQAENATAV